MYGAYLALLTPNTMFTCSCISVSYHITGIIRGRKVSRITFFAIVHEKTLMIQAISYIKIPAEIESARKCSRLLPHSRNSRTFSSADNSHYTVITNICMYHEYIRMYVYTHTLLIRIDIVMEGYYSIKPFMYSSTTTATTTAKTVCIYVLRMYYFSSELFVTYKLYFVCI